MAIRLASAVGQQRTPVDMYGGIDDAINKAGDAIQAEQVRKAEAAAKKKDQEQKYKDAVLATTTFEPLTDVHPKDREKDLAEKKAAFADLVVSSTDPNITKAQFDEKKRKFKEMADNNKYVMERDWKSISSVADKSDSGKGTHDTSRYDDFLMGKTNPTQVSDMPNDDFMAASEGNIAGTLPSENLPSGQGALQNLPNDPNVQGELVLLPNDPNFQGKLEELSKNPNLRGIEQSDGSVRVINKGGQNVSAGNKMNEMKRTETSTLYQGKNYLDLPIEERLKIDINAKENELTTLKKPNIVKAVQGYEGQDFKFGSLTKATTRISPTTGEIIYDFDEEKADKIGRRFASSMVGEGNFGSKEHSQYQRALEYKALKAGNDAGLSGDKLKDFVKEYVPRVAYDDFMRNARAAEAERSKNEKDITKQPSKGLIINNGNGMFSNGNTSMNKTDEITPYVQRKYQAKENQIKANIEKLKSSTNPTDQQTAKAYENSLSDLERLKASEAKDHIKYSNAKAKDDQYVTYGIVSGKDKNGNDIKENISFRPEDFFERNGKWYMAGEEKVESMVDDKKVVTYTDREIPLDENNYKKLITEDKLVIPLLEQHGITANEVGEAPTKAAPKAATKPMTQDEFNKKWASLKKGESIVAPNGQTYKKK
jgi:hypothetical protein